MRRIGSVYLTFIFIHVDFGGCWGKYIILFPKYYSLKMKVLLWKRNFTHKTFLLWATTFLQHRTVMLESDDKNRLCVPAISFYPYGFYRMLRQLYHIVSCITLVEKELCSQDFLALNNHFPAAQNYHSVINTVINHRDNFDLWACFPYFDSTFPLAFLPWFSLEWQGTMMMTQQQIKRDEFVFPQLSTHILSDIRK